MEWYWWVLLVAVIIVGGYIKLKVLGKWMDKRKKDAENIPEDE
jgi:hypothetical protein